MDCAKLTKPILAARCCNNGLKFGTLDCAIFFVSENAPSKLRVDNGVKGPAVVYVRTSANLDPRKTIS